MKGFMKRDFYLSLPNLKFFGVVLGAFAILVAFTDLQASFMALYAVVFSMSAVMSLFSYDEANHWPAYAAAVPGGRRGQVDGRYALSLLLCGSVVALLILVSLLRGEGSELGLTIMYAGIALIYTDVTLPLLYHFGGTKGRTVMIVLMALVAGIAGAGGAILTIGGGIGRVDLTWIALPLLAVGLVGLVISRSLSIKIVERKQF